MQFQLAKYHVFKHTMHCNANKNPSAVVRGLFKMFEKKIDIQIPDAVVRDAVPLFKNRVLKRRLIIYGCSSMRGSCSQQNIIMF